jgi:type I restriction enzyme M protein
VTQEHPVRHQPVPSGKSRADYVVWDPDNGLPLGVIEVRKPLKTSPISSSTRSTATSRTPTVTTPSGNLLSRAVAAIEELSLTEGDAKGEIYEHLLGKHSTAGQFRSPRHIIAAMVEMLNPRPTDTVCDPACGTGAFLISVMLCLYEKYSTAALEETDGEGN